VGVEEEGRKGTLKRVKEEEGRCWNVDPRKKELYF
jgi:hypothetical protein